MQCEDNAKLRTPLKEVCQTTDIGCVPITSGKPDCSPQPDELPLAFDPSTTTLWLFRCTDRTWVPFQKFSMCQLNSINLDNIKNICDILQIGVTYNPGGGCQQGTITLAELAEQLLKCIKLQTKTLAVTSSGDKLKIWIDGLDDVLPPFFVKGENIWTEGGDGTEGNPLKVVTHDPICKWPTRTQAQVNAATVKHLGACLDGAMARVPYPPSPCEFPQTTAERVEASRDKDMIVCVDGENAKVPIPDGLLTPICENPQISVNQAKAKPKLRIVACEDGKVVLFPLPPGMFDTEYMCVPFVDGVPSGPPVEGSGPIRFDCNNDIWFWVCEENRWYRIDVGNHYHPPWKEVYDFIANRCDNIKFHGWSEQDQCYTDFEMTPQELADFILCECLDVVTPVQANAAIGRDEQVKFPICVNGVAKKIDWSLCSWPYRSPQTINADIKSGKEANLGICVDGKNYKTNWNVCAYPEIDFDGLSALIAAQKELKFALCADGENHISSIRNVIERFVGIEMYSAGSHGSGYYGYRYDNITTQDGVFIVRSKDGSFVKGSGTNENQGPPFGTATITVTNTTNLLKLYVVFQRAHIQRHFDTTTNTSNCSFGMITGTSSSTSFCEIGQYISDNWANYSGSGSGSDNPWWDARTCEQRKTSDPPWQGKPQVASTSQFDISRFDYESNRFVTHCTLDKYTSSINRYSMGWEQGVQVSADFNFGFFYLLPNQSTTITQEALFTVSDYDGGKVWVGGHHRIFVMGFSGTRVANGRGDDDD